MAASHACFSVSRVLAVFEAPGAGVTVEVVPAAKAVLLKLTTSPPATTRAPILLTMLCVFIAVSFSYPAP